MKHGHHRRFDLEEIAVRAMEERGLHPDFSESAKKQAKSLHGPAVSDGPDVRDLRHLPWCSIDNDDSRDLDQLTYAEDLGDGSFRAMVAVADVDALVKLGSAIDAEAAWNTTSVYTPARIFPMLPERLSTDLSSLNPHEERLAVIVSYVVLPDGSVGDYEVYRAAVFNQAKLAYNAVAAWMDGEGPLPEAAEKASGVEQQLRLQDGIANRLRENRHEHGALELETIEPRTIMQDGNVVEMVHDRQNRAKGLIEDFMIAANGVTTRFLSSRGYPTFRRVVRSPERWDRIERLAEEYGEKLPPDPDSVALEGFLKRQKRRDPVRFPDLSLSVIKLLGAGEYVVQRPGVEGEGHFGLAVRHYSHSTAPNRRFPDLVTHRLLKAALHSKKPSYAFEELDELARHCTEQEDNVNRVERQVRKSAAAILLSNRIGETFEGIVTGDSPKGVWVRIFHPPVEGKLQEGGKGVDVGDRIRVRLVETDPWHGFIDFVRAH